MGPSCISAGGGGLGNRGELGGRVAEVVDMAKERKRPAASGGDETTSEDFRCCASAVVGVGVGVGVGDDDNDRGRHRARGKSAREQEATLATWAFDVGVPMVHQ